MTLADINRGIRIMVLRRHSNNLLIDIMQSMPTDSPEHQRNPQLLNHRSRFQDPACTCNTSVSTAFFFSAEVTNAFRPTGRKVWLHELLSRSRCILWVSKRIIWLYFIQGFTDFQQDGEVSANDRFRGSPFAVDEDRHLAPRVM